MPLVTVDLSRQAKPIKKCVYNDNSEGRKHIDLIKQAIPIPNKILLNHYLFSFFFCTGKRNDRPSTCSPHIDVFVKPCDVRRNSDFRCVDLV